MKKIIMFLIVLLLFDCKPTRTYILNDVLWKSQGKAFENNYKKGNGRLVKNKRFNAYIKKDS
jgi:hypothetical protein